MIIVIINHDPHHRHGQLSNWPIATIRPMARRQDSYDVRGHFLRPKKQHNKHTHTGERTRGTAMNVIRTNLQFCLQALHRLWHRSCHACGRGRPEFRSGHAASRFGHRARLVVLHGLFLEVVKHALHLIIKWVLFFTVYILVSGQRKM